MDAGVHMWRNLPEHKLSRTARFDGELLILKLPTEVIEGVPTERDVKWRKII